MVAHTKTRKLGIAAVLLVLAVLWLLGPLAAPPVEAGSGVYSEDFTTRTYKDESATNATGWGSGVLRLPRNISLASYVGGDWARAVQVVGNLMYASLFHPGGLMITNVSNPASPQDLGYCRIMEVTFGMYVSGNFAYLAGYASGVSEGLSIVFVFDPTDPGSVSNCTTNAIGYDVYKTGNYAYLASDGGFLTIDVANPANPSVVDTDDPSLDYYCLDGAGSYIYAGVGSRLQIFSITTPANPSKVGYCDLPYTIDRVSVSGSYAYAACSDYGLYIINVTTPASPNVVASYSIPDGADSVFALGGYAYVGSENYSLCVFDVSSPASPYPVGRWYAPIYDPVDVYVVADYAYVGYAGGVIILDLSDLDDHTSPAAAQSLAVYSGPAGARLTTATLACTDTQPTGTSISYLLSPDDGLNWEPVTPGIEHTFTNTGHQLKWKVLLTSSDPAITPEVTSLSINYRTMLQAPSLVTPNDDTLTSDDTPTFQWTSIVGASEYLLQLDRVAAFNSLDLTNVTAGTNSYTPTTGLADGRWYWRVAARDSQNDFGFFSASRTMVIDTTPPAWATSPVNQIAELGSVFRYDLNASDAWGISSWWINDTATFAIDSNGVIVNHTWLYLGTYGLEVRVYDQVGHNITASFSVTVYDTMAPVWVTGPTNQVLDYGVALQLELAVSDFSRIDRWEINDTLTFEIHFELWWFEGKYATIDNQTTLVPGVYGLTVTVYDFFDNYRSATFTVTVRESTTTTTTPPIPGFPLPAIAIGICTALIPIVALRRRRRR